MKTAIASTFAALSLLTGCGNDVQPQASSQPRYQLTREGVLVTAPDERTVIVALPGWIWADAPYCPPAIALGPRGEVVVTSNVVPTLWRVNPRTLGVTMHPVALNTDTDKDVGFSRLVYSSELAGFIAYSTIHRSVWKIDAALTRAEKISAQARAGSCADPA
jgi:hypothetical protein